MCQFVYGMSVFLCATPIWTFFYTLKESVLLSDLCDEFMDCISTILTCAQYSLIGHCVLICSQYPQPRSSQLEFQPWYISPERIKNNVWSAFFFLSCGETKIEKLKRMLRTLVNINNSVRGKFPWWPSIAVWSPKIKSSIERWMQTKVCRKPIKCRALTAKVQSENQFFIAGIALTSAPDDSFNSNKSSIYARYLRIPRLGALWIL